MKPQVFLLTILLPFSAIFGCSSNSKSQFDPLTTASLSATTFDFGNNLVSNTLTRTVVTITNTGVANLILNPTLTGDRSYSIASATTCAQQLAPALACNIDISYSPTASSQQTASLNLNLGNVAAGTPQTVVITGAAASLLPGQVTPTNNPQVALYTMTLPFPGAITVNFGPDSTYGLKTWTQSSAVAHGQVSIFVAGMRASSTYHMQAVIQFTNGIIAHDIDHSFTTGPVPANMSLNVSATTTPGTTAQPGLEFIDAVAGAPTGVIITDLAGNILWTYADPGNPLLNIINGAKLLPNGNFLMVIGPLGIPTANAPSETIDEIREVNLAGDTVREIALNDLNATLATATCTECHVTLISFHHDIEPLPNGHWLVLANTLVPLSPTTTPALTNSPPTTVLGDVIIDLDQNLQPVWVWNQFNHLDPNRHPMGLPDWTHTNAVLYSKDDGNILVSSRHQNWIMKVNYANGSGDGSILWRLGEGGDFTLRNGADPIDWQYAQHGPSFFTPNTTGVFSLAVMDNGNDRIFPAGVICSAPNAPPCFYSTIPVWQISEAAKTATLTFHQTLPPSLYSNFGGNVEQLANGNIEYDLGNTSAASDVFEVTPQPTPQTIWHMHVTGTYFYRAFRIPSLYPGVQW
jgi:hypothetical protein